MKNRWKQRALALMAVLALTLPTAGLASEVSEDAELFDSVIYIDAVEEAEELGEVDLDEILSEDAAQATVVPEITLTPVPEAEIAPDGEEAPETSTAPEISEAPGTTGTDTPAPEAKTETQEAPRADPDPQGTDTPGTDAPETAPAGEADPEAEASQGGDDPEATETARDGSDPEAIETADGETDPEASDAAGEAAAPEASETPAATATPAPTPAPEAAVIPAEEAQAAKAAEAAPALSFPTARLNMGKGERLQLAAQLTGAEGVTVTYASSKKKVVSVDGAGNLHARKKGTAKITATASNGLTATCTVKVYKAPSKVKLNVKSLIFGAGEVRALKAKLSRGSASTITWTSSNPAVVTVDAAGNLTGVGVGGAKITARTFNGKKSTCSVTVLGGRTPTKLTFPSKSITMGLKENRRLAPILGDGEAAVFTFSSSKKKIVSVNRDGVMTARKKGTAKITVKTHNGLKYKLTVKVTKAPSKITLSKTSVSLLTGKDTILKATLPANTGSAITWTSSNPNVASVLEGYVLALNPGTTQITASTFNGKSAACTVTVTAPSPATVPPNLSNAQMAQNLRNSSALGSKKNAIANIAEVLMNAGFEPSFAAGVCANVYSEGTYGLFESSKYIANYLKRPMYFCYLDGGMYYKNGVPAIEYVSPDLIQSFKQPDGTYKRADGLEVRTRYGAENYYMNTWSGKYVWNVDLNVLQAFIDALTAGNWQGKFGLGVVQWTGGRTRKLMARYHKYAGEGNPTITKEQVIAAENEMILYDLQGDYKFVHDNWKKANSPGLYCPEAAYSAGSLVCLKYEIPANKEQSAIKRGNNAAKFYNIMIGAE